MSAATKSSTYDAGFAAGASAARTGIPPVDVPAYDAEWSVAYGDGYAAYGRCSPDERAVLDAVVALNDARRSTNSSQVSRRVLFDAGVGPTLAKRALSALRARHLIRDVGKGTAYNWRVVR